MEEWKEYRLGEVANILDSKRVPLSSKERQAHKGIYPYYGAQGIIDYVDNYLFDGDYLLVAEDGENIQSRKEPIARIAKGKYWVNNHAHILENKGQCDLTYLCYLLNRLDISGYVTGSAQPKLNQANMQKIQLKLPPLQYQIEVVKIISSIDDKIDINRKINSNLEEQAKALFKSWFIDFEPFSDGDFEDTELGRIPKGWSVKSIGDTTTNIKEKVGDRKDVKVLSPITTGSLVLSEDYFSKQVFSESVTKYIVVHPNDFAYNPARINIGSIGMNEFSYDGCVSPVYVVFRTEPDYEYFFDLFRQTTFFKEEVKKRAIGGVRQTLSYKDLSLIRLVYPPKSIVHRFNTIYLSLLEEIKKNNVCNARLERLRDTLLPRLMSGELVIR